MAEKSNTKTRIKTNLDIKEPGLYNVVYLDDDVTTTEFVIESLVGVFGHSYEVAEELMQLVHNDGLATVATLPYEIAEAKGVEVTRMARNNNMPLHVRLEQE